MYYYYENFLNLTNDSLIIHLNNLIDHYLVVVVVVHFVVVVVDVVHINIVVVAVVVVDDVVLVVNVAIGLDLVLILFLVFEDNYYSFDEQSDQY